MNCFFFRWSLAALFACSTCLSTQAAEYCLRPSKSDGTKTRSVVCCTTPAGWQGWKDDPKHLTGTQRLLKDPLTRALFQMSVAFFPSNCVAEDRFRKKRPECPSLTLRSRARDPYGRPNVARGLRDFLRELQDHPPDVHGDCDPVVSRFGSFDAGNSEDPTIWQIHCRKRSPSNDYLLTMITQRDVLVTIYLAAANIKDIESKLDSLKELGRSVRITDASLALPDIVEIKIDHLSDASIRQQLLRLGPVGTPIEKVYDVLQSHLYKEVHRSKDGLWIEIGSYSKPVSQPTAAKSWPPSEEEIRSRISDRVNLPPTIVVRAFWKFDKERKLRDIEIHREVVEFESKQ
jgi:hypothetical protein